MHSSDRPFQHRQLHVGWCGRTTGDVARQLVGAGSGATESLRTLSFRRLKAAISLSMVPSNCATCGNNGALCGVSGTINAVMQERKATSHREL